MKEIVQKEVVKWFCDATGKEITSVLGQETSDTPSCIIKFDFGYSSTLDGRRFELHFDDDAAQDILDMICDKYPNVAKIVKEKIDGYVDVGTY